MSSFGLIEKNMELSHIHLAVCSSQIHTPSPFLAMIKATSSSLNDLLNGPPICLTYRRACISAMHK
jgi:hypothetical protein